MSERNFYNLSRTSDIVAGLKNFAQQIAADYASLGLTSAQAVEFGALNAALQSAWIESVTPNSRTSVSIANRGVALKQARAMAINLTNIIYGTPAVTNDRLVALGLLPRGGRTRSQPITETPAVKVMDVTGRNIRIRVRDASGSVRGKLPAAVGALVYTFVGPTPPSGVEGWTRSALITRDSVWIAFDGVAAGTTVWFAAQWFNSKGVGPGSTPVAAVIGIEGSLAA